MTSIIPAPGTRSATWSGTSPSLHGSDPRPNNEETPSLGRPPAPVNSTSELQLRLKVSDLKKNLLKDATEAIKDKDILELGNILRNPSFKGLKVPISDKKENLEFIRLLKAHDALALRTNPFPDKENAVLDSSTVALSDRSKSDVFSSHESTFVNDGMHDYYMKFNHHGPVSTFFEVLSARINKRYFPSPYAPEVKFASNVGSLAGLGFRPEGKYTKVGIASRMVEGFEDWGSFLSNRLLRDEHGSILTNEDGTPQVKSDSSSLKFVQADDREKYETLLRDYDRNRVDIETKRKEIIAADPIIGEYLKKKVDYSEVDLSLVEKMQPVRDLEREALQLQDQMLDMLPKEFSSSFRQALAEGKALGNKDVVNHVRSNAGTVVWNDTLMGATCIDFGVTGFNTFSGRHLESDKQDQDAIEKSLRRTARLDDPFLYTPRSKTEKEALAQYIKHGTYDPDAPTSKVITDYMQLQRGLHDPDAKIPKFAHEFIQRDLFHKDMLKFSYIPPTSGFIDPRGAAYAVLLRDDIWKERELDKKSEEFLRTAYRLSLIDKDELKEIVREAWNECAHSDDQNLKEMIKAVEDEGYSINSISGGYNDRFTNFVATAGDELAKWKVLNTDKIDTPRK